MSRIKTRFNRGSGVRGCMLEPMEGRMLYTVSILTHGALTTKLDNTAEINAAITAASQLADKTVYVPPGQFKHTGVIELHGGVELYGAGNFGGTGTKSELRATSVANDPTNSIRVSGANTKLKKLLVSTSWTGGRESQPFSHAVRVEGASYYLIEGVEVSGSAAGGIFTHGASNNGGYNNNRVHHTLADGIHITGTSHHLSVTNNTVWSTGDDAIAVVSYVNDSGLSGAVTISGNSVSHTGFTHGRGITVVGGYDVTIDNNTVTDSPMAGIYVASEQESSPGVGSNTRGVDDVIITRNTITHANTQNLGGHGGILVTGRAAYQVTDVTIGHATDATKKNTITNSVGIGVRIGSNTGNIQLLRNVIDITTSIGVKVTSSASVKIDNNTIKRTGQYGILFEGNNTGTATISGNILENINTSNTAGYMDVINVGTGSTFSSLTITNNNYTNPGNYVMERFIECHFSAVVHSGNTTPTDRPIWVAPL